MAAALVLVAVGAALLGTGAGGAAAPRIPTQPMPNGPVYQGVPGALPPGFAYQYNALSVGWPVQPRTVQHPIRGAFIDPRGADDNGLSGYHFGVDINVDDRHPDAGAPAGRSHAVYSLDAGVVSTPNGNAARRCVNRRMDVGHFSYWHVSSIVPAGTRVRAGQQIAWTCEGVWHVHLSEWQRDHGMRVWVNPLHRGGALVPYADTAPPVVRRLLLVSPPPAPWRPTTSLAQPDGAATLAPAALHGQVEVRALIDDPQSTLGFLAEHPAWPTRWTPYRVAVEIRDARTGKVVLSRVSFQADQMPQTPYLVHYAPGSVEDDNMQECVGPPPLARCDGSTWLRPLSRFGLEAWDTRTVPNGSYRITVRAADIAGNTGAASVDVAVRN